MKRLHQELTEMRISKLKQHKKRLSYKVPFKRILATGFAFFFAAGVSIFRRVLCEFCRNNSQHIKPVQYMQSNQFFHLLFE